VVTGDKSGSIISVCKKATANYTAKDQQRKNKIWKNNQPVVKAATSSNKVCNSTVVTESNFKIQ